MKKEPPDKMYNIDKFISQIQNITYLRYKSGLLTQKISNIMHRYVDRNIYTCLVIKHLTRFQFYFYEIWSFRMQVMWW